MANERQIQALTNARNAIRRVETAPGYAMQQAASVQQGTVAKPLSTGNAAQIVNVNFLNNAAGAQEVLFGDLRNAIATAYAAARFTDAYAATFTSSLFPQAAGQTSTFLLGGANVVTSRFLKFQSLFENGAILKSITVNRTNGTTSAHQVNLFKATGTGQAVQNPQNTAANQAPFNPTWTYDFTQMGQVDGALMSALDAFSIVIPTGEALNVSISIVALGASAAQTFNL